MIILGIETATQICAVGLTGEKGFITDYRLQRGTIHAEHLPGAIETVTADAGISIHEIDGIAVSIGPGSFTGLRIGLSMAKGLALGLDIPLIEVPTLDGIVSQIPGYCGWACVLLLARKGEFYQGLYRWNEDGWLLNRPYQVVQEEKIGVDFPKSEILFLGEGLSYCQEIIQQRIKKARFLSPVQSFASGYAVAEKGRIRLLEGKTSDIDTIAPLYLKKFQGVG